MSEPTGSRAATFKRWNITVEYPDGRMALTTVRASDPADARRMAESIYHPKITVAIVGAANAGGAHV